ncbi:hypothetical protein ABZP36_003176 [Zizania latifolia]
MGPLLLPGLLLETVWVATEETAPNLEIAPGIGHRGVMAVPVGNPPTPEVALHGMPLAGALAPLLIIIALETAKTTAATRAPPQEGPSEKAMEKYLDLFKEPLTDAAMEAILSLAGLSI